MGLVNDAAARSESDRDIEMHRVPQRLGLVELLHPDRRSVSKGVHRIIVSHRHVPDHGAPEAEVNRIALRRDRELHLLDGRTIRSCTVRPRDGRHGPCELDVSWLEAAVTSPMVMSR